MTDLKPMMPRYEEYKDSGVEWIGEIPEHWEIKRLKHIGSAIIGLTYSPEDLCSKEDGTLVLRSSNLGEGFFKFGEKINVYVNCNIPNKLKIKKEDILICSRNGSRDLIGKCAIATNEDSNLSFGAFTTVFRSKLNFYLFHILNSTIFKSLSGMFLTSTINQLTISNLNSIEVAIPPRTEQITIAKFLNCKTTKIDQAVAIKEKQIQLLKERKQILIQNAVTRGLDPDAPMRDSDVEWIGEIPVHWQVKRAKYLFNEVDERSTTGEEELLSVSHMTGVTPRSEKNVNMFLAEDYTGSKTCQKNDLVFNIMWAWMGALGVSGKSGIVSSSYGIFRQLKEDQFNPNYLEYLLKTTGYIEHYNKVSTGLHSSRLRFYSHMFLNMEIGFPDKKEQDQIIAHIQTQSVKIDKTIAIQERMIEKLKEYKTTLINSAVTGKIKVPGAGPTTGKEKAVA